MVNKKIVCSVQQKAGKMVHCSDLVMGYQMESERDPSC